EHAERIVVADVLLGGERKTREILEGVQIIGMHARRIEFLAISGDILVGVAQRLFQAIELERRNFVARSLFDRREAEGHIGCVDHPLLRPYALARAGARDFRPGTISPSIVRECPRNSAMTKPSSRVTVTS